MSKRQNNETVLLEPVSYFGTIGLGGAKCLVEVLKGKALFRVLKSRYEIPQKLTQVPDLIQDI